MYDTSSLIYGEQLEHALPSVSLYIHVGARFPYRQYMHFFQSANTRIVWSVMGCFQRNRPHWLNLCSNANFMCHIFPPIEFSVLQTVKQNSFCQRSHFHFSEKQTHETTKMGVIYQVFLYQNGSLLGMRRQSYFHPQSTCAPQAFKSKG